MDCATSIIQNGKIEYYARIGKDTPAGMVIGRDGSTLTDSAQILKDLRSGNAALAPLGGIGETPVSYTHLCQGQCNPHPLALSA